MLLVTADWAIELVERSAGCFVDGQIAGRVEHGMAATVGAAGIRGRPGLQGPHGTQRATPRPGDQHRDPHGYMPRAGSQGRTRSMRVKLLTNG